MTRIELKNLTRRFGTTIALDRINLTIEPGELFFLLGPSGCGKSTLLRIIAGLLEPTDGSIYFNGRDVTAFKTQKRNAVMCFQSYALWPHLSVRDNVRFGLDIRRVSKRNGNQRVDEVLALVQLDKLADRKPNQLSGGQQQRVALARALAVKPDCLLLDEPLSNLDAKLRTEMRTEIRRICKSTGVTTVYVTHDQKEALSVADRIAVLKDGKLMQLGTPQALYHHPQSTFVADFVGQTNLLRGQVVAHEPGIVRVKTAIGQVAASAGNAAPVPRVALSIRPEQLHLVKEATFGDGPSTQNHFRAQVVESTFQGESSEHLLTVDGQRLKMICTPPVFNLPARVTIRCDARDITILPDESD